MMLTNRQSSNFVWNEFTRMCRFMVHIASIMLLLGGNVVEATGSTCVPSSATSATSRSAAGGASSKKSNRDRMSAIMRSTSEGSPDSCAVAYSDGSAWNIGDYGQDVIDFGGATGTKEVCLVTMGSTTITNAIGNGPELADGIMGLAPGCTSSEKFCEGNETDVISILVDAGSISGHTYTMCHNENGGKLFLGPASDYPDDTMWFPIFPFAANSEEGSDTYPWYVLKGPSDGGNVQVLQRDSEGNETDAYCASNEEYINNLSIMFDSGTFGAELPPDVFASAINATIQSWVENEDATAVLEKLVTYSNSDIENLTQWNFSSVDDDTTLEAMNVLSSGNLFDSIYEVLGLDVSISIDNLVMSKEDAALLNELVPDIIVRGLDGGDLVLDGNTFLFETLPGSGIYGISWRPGDPNDGTIAFGGTAFLLDKTVVYDDANGRIGVMTEPAGDCSKFNYSENGDVIEMSAPGGKSNLFGPGGAFLGEIELGGQMLMVQLDTGSNELLLYSGVTCVQIDDTENVGSCFTALPTSNNGTFGAGFYPKDEQTGNCSKYNSVLEATNGTYLPVQEFYEMFATQVQPYSTCSVQRDLCGELNKFDPTESSSFTYIPAGSTVKILENAISTPSLSLSDINGATCNLNGTNTTATNKNNDTSSNNDVDEGNDTSNANLISYYHGVTTCMVMILVRTILFH